MFIQPDFLSKTLPIILNDIQFVVREILIAWPKQTCLALDSDFKC